MRKHPHTVRHIYDLFVILDYLLSEPRRDAFEGNREMHRRNQRDVKLFFVLILVLFSGFLSILFPFKTSLTPSFPSVPALSVANYVVKTEPRWINSNKARLLYTVWQKHRHPGYTNLFH